MPIIRHKGINYAGSSDDISNSELNYESGDELDPSEPTEVAQLTNTETTKSFAQKVSTAVKNIRYLLKMLGSTDISTIGDGTTTGAIKSLKEGMTAENIGAFPGTIATPDGANWNNYKTPGVYSGYSDSSGSFAIIVLQMKGYVEQIYSPANSETDRFGYRFYSEDTETWSPWKYLPIGIKGNAETTYRGGLVNLTPENIGAVGAAGGIDFRLGVENGLLYYEEV